MNSKGNLRPVRQTVSALPFGGCDRNGGLFPKLHRASLPESLLFIDAETADRAAQGFFVAIFK